ncbi:MAG: family N-acetyltransferase [Sediminibacterium sp.]|nr:family N-acetyltransferase [Sediminibacterium sp.]
MTTRKATPEDIDAIAVLFDQYRVFYKQSSDLPGAKQFLTDRLQQDQSVIFVVLLDGKIVGFTQLYPVFSSVGMKRAWLLNDLFVSEESRGSGAADALLKAAQDMGTETSSRWLMLQTATLNHRAQRVYERNGWKRDGEYYSYYYKIG